MIAWGQNGKHHIELLIATEICLFFFLALCLFVVFSSGEGQTVLESVATDEEPS